MFDGFLPLLVTIGIILILIAGTISIIVSKDKGTGSAGLSAFYDLQTQEKRNAMAMVIEQKAKKKMQEQESGKKKSSE